MEESKEPKHQTSKDQSSVHRLPPKHSNQASHCPPGTQSTYVRHGSRGNSEIGSDGNTFDGRLKNNSRGNSRLNKFFGQGAVQASNDPLSDEDDQTEQTQDFFLEQQTIREESDQFMVTKFRNGQGRQYRLSQNQPEMDVTQNTKLHASELTAGKSFNNQADYDPISQHTILRRRGTENVLQNKQISEAGHSETVQKKTSSIQFKDPNLSVPNSMVKLTGSDFQSDHQITSKGEEQLFRKVLTISSKPVFEFEQSNGTNIECLPQKINQARLKQKVSGLTLEAKVQGLTLSQQSMQESQNTAELYDKKEMQHKLVERAQSNFQRPNYTSQKTDFILMHPIIRDSSSLMKGAEKDSDTQNENMQDQIIMETSLEEANISFQPTVINRIVDQSPQQMPEQISNPANNEQDPEPDFELRISSGETMMEKQNRSTVQQILRQDYEEPLEDDLLTKSENIFVEEQIISLKTSSQGSKVDLYQFGHQGGGVRKSRQEQIGQINEQVIFSRLPQNYFLQDEEPEDIFSAQNQIQMMREGFISYVHHTHMPSSDELEMDNIQEALDPTTFIQRHFGNQGVQDPEFMFKEIIKEVPEPIPADLKSSDQNIVNVVVNSESTFKIVNGDLVSDEAELITGEIFLKDAKLHDSQTQETVLSVQKEQVHDYDNIPVQDRSPDNRSDYTRKQSEPRQNFQYVEQAEINVTKKGLKKKSKKSNPLQDFRRQPIKHIKMADYFSQKDKPYETFQDNEILASNEDAAQQIIDKWRNKKPISNISNNHSFVKEEDFKAHFVQEQEQAIKKKIEFEKKLEQDILDNVDTNFIFNKGSCLTTGLIDQERIYNIMNKLKDLAFKQLNQGSKEIDYKEIVKFIQQDENFSGDIGRPKKYSIPSADIFGDDLSGIVQEPAHLNMVNNEEENQRRWETCMKFLRNNPKLLLQMIPDLSDDDVEDQPRHNLEGNSLFGPKPYTKLNKGKLHQKMEEAKQFSGARPNKFIAHKINTEIDLKPYGPDKQAIKSIFGVKPKAEQPDQSSVERKELCSSGNPLKRKKMGHFTSIPLSSKNYPQDQLSFITRSGIQPEVKEENQNSTNSFQTYNNQLTQVNSSSKTNLQDLSRNPLSVKIRLPRGQSSQGVRIKHRSPHRPQTGTQFKTAFHSDSNYQIGEFVKAFESQNLSSTSKAVNLNVMKRQGGQLQIQSQNSCNSGNQMKKRVQDGRLAQDQESCAVSGASGFFSGPNVMKRPITAGVVRSLVDDKNCRARLASNKILQIHANQRHSLRQIQFSKGASIFTSKNMNHLLSNGIEMMSKNSIGKPVPEIQDQVIEERQRKFCKQKKSRSGSKKFYNSHGQTNLKRRKQSKTVKERSIERIEIEEEKDEPTIDIARFETVQQTNRNQNSKNRASEEQINAELQEKVAYLPKQSSHSSLNYDRKDFSSLQCRPESQSPYNDTASNLLRGLPIIKPQQSNHKGETTFEERPVSDCVSQGSIYQGVTQIPNVDWAYTPLCINMLQNKREFNSEKDIRFFSEHEIDFVIEMIQKKFNEFKKTEVMLPFYTKALDTLQAVLEEQKMHAMFGKFRQMYQEVTIENTLKLMLRSKLAFHSRKILMNIFDAIMKYELNVKEVQKLLDQQTAYKIEVGQLSHVKLMSGRMKEAGDKVFQQIKLLKQDKKSNYNQPFVFKKKDIINQFKNDMSEIGKLIDVLRPKRRVDSPDSEKKGRYTAGIDDVPSSTSTEQSNRASSNNFNAATEPYWEPTQSMRNQEKAKLREDRYKQKQKKPDQKHDKKISSVDNEHFSKKWYKAKKEW